MGLMDQSKQKAGTLVVHDKLADQHSTLLFKLSSIPPILQHDTSQGFQTVLHQKGAFTKLFTEKEGSQVFIKDCPHKVCLICFDVQFLLGVVKLFNKMKISVRNQFLCYDIQ